MNKRPADAYPDAVAPLPTGKKVYGIFEETRPDAIQAAKAAGKLSRRKANERAVVNYDVLGG
jgi:hypothetical protein